MSQNKDVSYIAEQNQKEFPKENEPIKINLSFKNSVHTTSIPIIGSFGTDVHYKYTQGWHFWSIPVL